MLVDVSDETCHTLGIPQLTSQAELENRDHLHFALCRLDQMTQTADYCLSIRSGTSVVDQMVVALDGHWTPAKDGLP